MDPIQLEPPAVGHNRLEALLDTIIDIADRPPRARGGQYASVSYVLVPRTVLNKLRRNLDNLGIEWRNSRA